MFVKEISLESGPLQRKFHLVIQTWISVLIKETVPHVFMGRATFSVMFWRTDSNGTFKRCKKVGGISERFQRENNKQAGNHCSALIIFSTTTVLITFYHDVLPFHLKSSFHTMSCLWCESCSRFTHVSIVFKSHPVLKIPVHSSGVIYVLFCASLVHSSSLWRCIVLISYTERALTYLLTYSMEQSPSWEANWFCS